MTVSSNTTAAQEMQDDCFTHGDFVNHGIKIGTTVMWRGCPLCRSEKDAKLTEEYADKERRERDARYKARLGHFGIPRRFENKTFDTFMAVSEAQQKAVDVARSFAAEFPKHFKAGTCVVFSGKPGTGKSHLALAIAQTMLPDQSEWNALYVTAREMVMQMRASWGKEDGPSELTVLSDFVKRHLLIIDEVGSQFGSDAELTQFFSVIDARYREQRPTILLTNLNRDGLSQFIGERAFDRLREDGIWVAFDWESHRHA